jgi:hypothetical protein
MFTRVHHAKIADAIRNTKAAHPETPEPLATLQAKLAEMFGADGSDFSPREFEAGCNPEPVQQRRSA